MNIVELEQTQERKELIDAVTHDAAQILDVDLENDPPQEIMKMVNETITNLVLNKPNPLNDHENKDLLLACLWGSQMQRHFNWYWADVTIDQNIKEVAMISPKQEMIIFPFSFVSACINKKCICTVLLFFNMLNKHSDFDQLEEGEYYNVMLDIHHIIPPYTLEPAD